MEVPTDAHTADAVLVRPSALVADLRLSETLAASQFDCKDWSFVAPECMQGHTVESKLQEVLEDSEDWLSPEACPTWLMTLLK